MERRESYFEQTKQRIEEEREKEREKARKKAIDFYAIPEPEKIKITVDERNRVINKARNILETGKGEFLTEEEEKILKQIAGVYYTVYKKFLNSSNKKEESRDDYEK